MSEAKWTPKAPEDTVKPEMSGTAPDPINPDGEVARHRVITSSGETPSGGEGVGGHADRIQPTRWARRHGSASGALDPGENYDSINDDYRDEPAEAKSAAV